MAVKFFGQYLLEKQVISYEAVLAAISLQERNNLKLGEMAVEMGYITEADIERAHNAQYSKDMKLGDLLVSQGILNNDQLDKIVARQKETHLYIGEALVRLGAITREELVKYLEEFKQDQAPYQVERIELPEGIANAASWEMVVDLTYKMITRVLGLRFKPEKCRVVDRLVGGYTMAYLDLIGDLQARYVLSVTADLQQAIARAILRVESAQNEPPDMLEDSVMEFINVICGNVAAKASQFGKIVEITPPETIHPPSAGLPVPSGHAALCFPIHVDDGEKMEVMELFLVIPK